MDFIAAVAFLTTIVSIAVKVIGLPDQIQSNYRRKSTAGLSSWFVLSAFLSYLLWTIHGLQVHDNALIIGQGLGVATTGLIVGQIVAYRKHTNDENKPRTSSEKTPDFPDAIKLMPVKKPNYRVSAIAKKEPIDT